MVRQDGPRSLAELSGKTLVFPSPRAFGATLLTRADLKRLDIPHDVSYLGTHESVYQDVARGRHVAGGGALHSFGLLPAAQAGAARPAHHGAGDGAHHRRAPARAGAGGRARAPGAAPAARTAGGRRATGQARYARLVVAVPADFESVRDLSWPVRPPALAFHIIPRLDAEAARQHLQPLAIYMRQRLELDVQTRVYGNMDDFEKAIYGPNAAALINANPAQAVRSGARGLRHHRPRAAGAVAGACTRSFLCTGQPLPDARRSPRPAHRLRRRRARLLRLRRPACDAQAGRAGGRLHGCLAPGAGHQRPCSY